MRQWMSARSPVSRIEPTIETGRPAPGPDLGSQLEDLRVHVLQCERWAQFDDRLDLALRTRAAGRA